MEKGETCGQTISPASHPRLDTLRHYNEPKFMAISMNQSFNSNKSMPFFGMFEEYLLYTATEPAQNVRLITAKRCRGTPACFPPWLLFSLRQKIVSKLIRRSTVSIQISVITY